MKKIFLLCLCISSGYAADFSGSYKCEVQDKTDGHFNAKLILKLNPETTIKGTGYASYDIDFIVSGMPYNYKGIAAARGNDLALYFESYGDKRNPDDKGVGIASVIVDKDKAGKDIVSIHKFYYEKSYKNHSNYGFEKCVKVDKV